MTKKCPTSYMGQEQMFWESTEELGHISRSDSSPLHLASFREAVVLDFLRWRLHMDNHFEESLVDLSIMNLSHPLQKSLLLLVSTRPSSQESHTFLHYFRNCCLTLSLVLV